MFAKPQKEHVWLEQLVGDWAVESECITGPDQAETNSYDLQGRSMLGMWVMLEGSGDMPETGKWFHLMTLGYNPQQEAYIGTFLGSMMTHMWLYKGKLDAAGTTLTLDTNGPTFDGRGTTNYQDSFEIVNPDHWIMRSQMQMEDGSWNLFMTAHHRRK